MKMFKYPMGIQLECIFSGFIGAVCGRCEYFNGCIQYLIKPRGLNEESGEPIKSRWIDEAQLKLVKGKQIKPVKGADIPGGPQHHPKTI